MVGGIARAGRGGRGLAILVPATFVLAGFLVTLLAPGCAVNPATGKREFSLVSRSQEVQMGREGDAAIQEEYGIYEDAKLAAYVDRVGQKLAAASEMPELDWHFRVLDSPVVNAFALPGGYIYITRGILAVLNSEAQLAGVLGHEIGHVTARHGAQQMTRAQLAGLGLGLGSMFLEDFRPYSGMAQQALGLLFLKYGRDDEHQADELGIRYAVRAGYDPREIPATYDALEHLGAQSGQSLPAFLSTHPDPGQREEVTRQKAEAAVAGLDAAGLQVSGPAYKHELVGLTYGVDPREGFAEGSTFYHPQMRFQLRFPDGWRIQNTRQAVTGLSADEKAAVELTLAQAGGAATPADYVLGMRERGSIARAEGTTGRVGSWPAWIGRIAIPRQSGGEALLHAAWVGRDPGRYFQFLGAPGDASGQPEFTSTLMSFRDLSDPAKLGRRPDRVRLVTVSQPSATLATVARGAPRLAIPLEEVAFLNHTTTDAVLRQGFLVKVVEKPAER